MKPHTYLLPTTLLTALLVCSCAPEPPGSYSFTRVPGQVPQTLPQDEQAELLQR